MAAAIGSSDKLLTDITETPGIIIGVIVLQLALVLGLVFLLPRLSVGMATFLFLLYSATVGVTFAFIFELYTTQSIFTAFLITAGMFGALAVWGAVTHIDLSKVGSIAFMALIGLILATVVNIFWANSTLYWITTYAGVAIFAALTAYDMQKLKQINQQGLTGDAEGARRSWARSPSTSTSSTSSSSCCGSSASRASRISPYNAVISRPLLCMESSGFGAHGNLLLIGGPNDAGSVGNTGPDGDLQG